MMMFITEFSSIQEMMELPEETFAEILFENFSYYSTSEGDRDAKRSTLTCVDMILFTPLTKEQKQYFQNVRNIVLNIIV